MMHRILTARISGESRNFFSKPSMFLLSKKRHICRDKEMLNYSLWLKYKQEFRLLKISGRISGQPNPVSGRITDL
jgi:hypothetical protein